MSLTHDFSVEFANLFKLEPYHLNYIFIKKSKNKDDIILL